MSGLNYRQNKNTDKSKSSCLPTYKCYYLDTCSTPTAKEVKNMGYFASNIHGNRIDALCDCVDNIINGSNKIKGIGDVKPSPRNHMTIYIPNSKYYGKCLKYNISNYNPGGNECGN